MGKLSKLSVFEVRSLSNDSSGTGVCCAKAYDQTIVFRYLSENTK